MAELARVWGVADSGESIEVALRRHLLPELARRWPPIGLVRHDVRSGVVRLSRGLSDEWVIIPGRGESGDDPSDAAWDQLEQTLTAFAVQRLGRRVAVHAAAIAWRGKVLLVPAASGGGKSSLALAAARAGASVLSDEYALLDPVHATATGWRRPIDIAEAGADGVTRHDVAVELEPLPVGLIAAVAFDQDRGNAWVPMTAAEAVGQLLRNCVTAALRPSESMDAALAVCRDAPAIQGTRGDADAAIDALLAMLE